MKILISGASGLVGTALTHALASSGHTVARLVRAGGALPPGDIRWDPTASTLDGDSLNAMEGANAVVHLSGASIAGGRWTPARKAMLRSSRVDSTRLLVSALAQLQRKPRVFVAASAVGYYGNRGDEILTESSSPGSDFLASVAQDWEAESARAEALGIRTVILRSGVILSAKEGALPQMLAPFRFGVGGRLGDGQQWMSWIALADVIGIIEAAIADERYTGPLNVVAPNPLRNAEFTRIVAHALHRPAIFAAPAFALRLMLGEMADALLLASQRAVPERLLAAGHHFLFSDFEAALVSLLHPKR
jgi:uncharacterized protein (TIGR01777 family)